MRCDPFNCGHFIDHCCCNTAIKLCYEQSFFFTFDLCRLFVLGKIGKEQSNELLSWMWLLTINHTRSSKLLVNYSIIDRHDRTFNEPFPVPVSWPIGIAWAFSRLLHYTIGRLNWERRRRWDEFNYYFPIDHFQCFYLLLIWRLFCKLHWPLWRVIFISPHPPPSSWGSTTFDYVPLVVEWQSMNWWFVAIT